MTVFHDFLVCGTRVIPTQIIRSYHPKVTTPNSLEELSQSACSYTFQGRCTKGFQVNTHLLHATSLCIGVISNVYMVHT